jgi:D-alanyl-D-alanine carboxypeptidase (penicillin-binding protein 5/6)
MMKARRFFSAVISIFMLIASAPTVYSDGNAGVAAVQADYADMTYGIEARSIYVCETNTGKVLCEQNSQEKMPMGHMAKLMTALIAAEELESGKLELTDEIVVSANANSKQGTQIWLDVGEKISVEELLKSITIGNANDACTALAEKMSGSEEAFVERMNKRAKRLNMKNTYFADSCGIDESTVSTAEDIAILSSNVVKHDNLSGYFLTWMDNVRCKVTELVNTNRLIRTYKGIKGLKSCSVNDVGECISACAKRDNLSICAVILGCKTQDDKFTYARNLLDTCFDKFRIYSPEIDEKLLENIKVIGGEKLEVGVKPKNLIDVVVPTGMQSQIEAVCDLPEAVEAPIKKDDVLAEIKYMNGDEDVLVAYIVADEDVKKMDFKCAVKKSLLNLLHF